MAGARLVADLVDDGREVALVVVRGPERLTTPGREAATAAGIAAGTGITTVVVTSIVATTAMIGIITDVPHILSSRRARSLMRVELVVAVFFMNLPQEPNRRH